MERQTKHRILGILVVIGLVIILLPLFQSNQELSSEAALVKAPPFPDQSVQVSAVTPDPEADNPVSETAAPSLSQNSGMQPEDVISATHPSVINHPQAVLPVSEIKAAENKTIQTNNYRIIEGDKAASVLKKSARINKLPHNTKAQTVASIKTPMKPLIKSPVNTPIDDDGLINLKSPVWVIQIGSFKNKANALRVVNQLRANGYRAFIQQISTALGDNTRVFVGPEHKRTTARALADRLQSEMHIQGMVISYKPLTL